LDESANRAAAATPVRAKRPLSNDDFLFKASPQLDRAGASRVGGFAAAPKAPQDPAR
jgi:hypothetical protein